MRRNGMTQLVMNLTALAIMWCAAIFLVGMLAGAAWALLLWGWGLIW
jgi:hypothetical protein